MYHFLCVLAVIFAVLGMSLAVRTVMYFIEWLHGEVSKLKLLISLILFGVFKIASLLVQVQSYVELKHMADTEYVVYLDGEEMDVDKIAFTQYSISVDEENKEILLSQKQNFKYIYIPFIR